MRTVVFLTGATEGNALASMGDAYGAQFRKLGYNFIHIDFRDPARQAGVIERIRNGLPIEFAFAFQNFGVNLLDRPGGCENLWHKMGIPFLSLVGDSPAYHFDLNICLAPNHARLYGFPEHETLRRRLPAVTNGYIGRYKPMTINGLELDALDFKAKAEGKLLFLKNGNDPKKLWESWNVLDAKPQKALRELASQLASDLTEVSNNQIDNLVTDYFMSCGFDLSAMLKLRLFFIAQLDHYLRGVKSAMMAEALMDFPVRIVGVEWEHLDFSGKRAEYVNECDYSNSNCMIREGLGVIDTSPNTGLSPHDRACRAFGAYTLCVTNEQEFFRENLPHPDAMCFRFDIDSFRDKIADVIAHPTRYVDVGVEVAAAFREAYSPEIALLHLADIAEMIKLDQQRERLPQSPDFFVWPPVSLTIPYAANIDAY